MTLGEKIRIARKSNGFSQEQLAERLSVSRSAIAKWETDKGLPDVGNLKMLARLLGVSVDHLLDDVATASASAVREAYCLAAYGQGCKKVKKDRFVCAKFPNARIYPLFARPEQSELYAGQKDGCCGQIQKTTDRSFYLVEQENRRLLVTVTDTYFESCNLEVDCDQFLLDGWSFIKSNYELNL